MLTTRPYKNNVSTSVFSLRQVCWCSRRVKRGVSSLGAKVRHWSSFLLMSLCLLRFSRANIFHDVFHHNSFNMKITVCSTIENYPSPFFIFGNRKMSLCSLFARSVNIWRIVHQFEGLESLSTGIKLTINSEKSFYFHVPAHLAHVLKWEQRLKCSCVFKTFSSAVYNYIFLTRGINFTRWE